SGSARLKELTGARMLMHAASPAPCVDRGLKDGDVVQLGALRIEVLATPGHTSDAVCLVLPGRVLTGDTLLIGGCGRADPPPRDPAAMFDSLQKLAALPEDTLVLPAHDYDGQRASTIGREKKGNGRMKIASAQEFMSSISAVHLPVPPGLEETISSNQKCL